MDFIAISTLIIVHLLVITLLSLDKLLQSKRQELHRKSLNGAIGCEIKGVVSLDDELVI